MKFRLLPFASFGIVVLALSAIGFAAAQKAPSTTSPDIFLITVDTLRADHVHCFNPAAVETPALDSLARDGVRFSQAFTPSPITNTSHASVLTGLLPSVHGVKDFGVPLAASHTTLAELLKQRGYHTAAFIGAVILDSHSLAPGFDRGFDFYDNFPVTEAGDGKDDKTRKSHWGRVERRGMDVVSHAETWLTKHPAGPRFLWVHLYDPHDPYEAPSPYAEKYKDHPYDGEIAYADSAFGHLLGYLKSHAAYQHSLIIVTGDHGEGLGEHHEETHGIFLYDATTHVPLIFKLPSQTHAGNTTHHDFAGRDVREQVRTLDILPTVLDLLSIPPPKRLDGASLRPLLTSSEDHERAVFGETDYPQRFGWAPLRSVRAQGFKFIEAPRPELYEIANDPGELSNTYQPWNDRVQKFRDMLTELRASFPPAAPSSATVGKGTIDELRALGYLGPEGTTTNVPEPSLLPDAKDKIEEQNLLHLAMMANEDGRVDEARAAFEKVLATNPGSLTTLLQLGELELKAGNFVKAAAYLGRAREMHPEDAAAALHHGQALEQLGELSGAREALESSLRIAPGQFPARLLLGSVLLRLNEAKLAQDQLEAALLLDGKSAEAWDLQAQVYAKLGDKAASATASAKATELRGGKK